MKKFYRILVSVFLLLIIIAFAVAGAITFAITWGYNDSVGAWGSLGFIVGLFVGFFIATIIGGPILIFISIHTHLEKMDATLSEIKKNLELQTNQSEKKSESSENSVQKETSNSESDISSETDMSEYTECDSWICPKCGAMNPAGTRFCSNCGK